MRAHFLLGHNPSDHPTTTRYGDGYAATVTSGGGNVADHVRRTIFYRLAVPGHPDRWERTFLDRWTEHPAERRALVAR